jgi:hypothetical protein
MTAPVSASTPIEWKLQRSRTKAGGMLLTSKGGRFHIRRVTWAKPGFKNQTSTGWAIFVDGEQWSAAFGTMTKCQAHADQPGVTRDLWNSIGVK